MHSTRRPARRLVTPPLPARSLPYVRCPVLKQLSGQLPFRRVFFVELGLLSGVSQRRRRRAAAGDDLRDVVKIPHPDELLMLNCLIAGGLRGELLCL